MLPAVWVDRLFAKMTVRYGQAFMRQYGDLDPALVKADWSEVLAGFDREPDALRYAVENLPEAPPNATQFRSIARRSPTPAAAALAAPNGEAPPDAIRALAVRMATPSINSAQECIERIERLCNGKPSPAQKHMVAHCLRMPGTSTKLPIEVAE